MAELNEIECPNCGEEIPARIAERNEQCPHCDFRAWGEVDLTLD